MIRTRKYNCVELSNKFPHGIFVIAETECGGKRRLRAEKISKNGGTVFREADSIRIKRIFKTETRSVWLSAEEIFLLEQKAYRLARKLAEELDRD